MSRLEEELHNALRPKDPPEGFAERVLARTLATNPYARGRRVCWSGLRWALAGALCLALLGAGIEVKRAQEQRARGQAVKARCMLALRLTASKLQLAQEKVQLYTAPWIYGNQPKEN